MEINNLDVKSPRSKHSRSKGFTLIEILVVVTVIGILAAVAVPWMVMAVEEAKMGEWYNFCAEVAESQEHYRLINGTYYLGPLDGTNCVLDICTPNGLPPLKNFGQPGNIAAANGNPSFQIGGWRNQPPAYIGNYFVVCAVNGPPFDTTLKRQICIADCAANCPAQMAVNCP